MLNKNYILNSKAVYSSGITQSLSINAREVIKEMNSTKSKQELYNLICKQSNDVNIIMSYYKKYDKEQDNGQVENGK